MGEINLTIDGKKITAPAGKTILEVARANGIDIPTLCYSPELTPTGACRLCVVEVQGSRTLVGSCHTPVSEGIVVTTNSPKVLQARRAIVELLLSSHPDSCVVCDKANLCELRQVATDLGVGLPHFRSKRRYYPMEDNPYIVRDLSKCVLCRRCVKACSELKKAGVFAVGYRGFKSKIVVDCDQPLDKEVCRDCEVCINQCPVGALSRRTETRQAKKGKPLIITASKK